MNVFLRLVVTAAVLVAGLGVAAPAPAAVTYDPKTMKGYVGSGDMRKAFGWTDATLAAKASTLVFNHNFWTDISYTVTCGRRVLPFVHHEQFGRYDLRHAAVQDTRRGAATGYARRLTGFWITGPSAGVSGTTYGPTVGYPCPDGGKDKVVKARKLRTTVGWSLSVSSGRAGRVLVKG
jgi:hypothetical protein